MYQLLLVDDEALVLDGLCEYIDWESLGFFVAGTAQNVKDALNILYTQSIDVLLTDIVMDKETGFDLVREAEKHFPNLKFVILSGFGEFSYALEAIRLGCVNFLTKPLDFDQCSEVFSTLAHTLDSERTALEDQLDLYQLKKEKFLRTFLETNNHEQNFFTYFPNIRPLYGIVLLHARSNTYPCTHQVLDEYFSAFFNHYILPLSSSNFCVLFSQIPPMEEFLSILTDLIQNKNELKNSFYIALGGLTADYKVLPRLFIQAQSAMKYRHLYTQNQLLQYRQLESLFHLNEFNYEIFEKKIANWMMENNQAEAQKYILSRALSLCTGETPNLGGLTNILLSLNRLLATQGLNLYQSDYNAFHTLEKIKTTDEAIEFLEEFTMNSLKLFQKQIPDSGNFIINQALEYIQNHFDEKLTLGSLSEIVYVTPTYLSRLFHNVVGKNFADYLAELRIDRAKKFLPDPSLKIYDIAIEVGYDNAKRFSKVFQEITGLTPSEYRTKILGGVSVH